METKHPATQESPRVLSTLFLSAAVTENKQSWAPTLHRDCGVNNSSLAFMMNSSGLQSSPIFFFLQSQDSNQRLFQLHSPSFMSAIMYDSLVFTHNTLRPLPVGPCLTLVVTSCQSAPGVREDGWDPADTPSAETPLAFQQRKEAKHSRPCQDVSGHVCLLSADLSSNEWSGLFCRWALICAL